MRMLVIPTPGIDTGSRNSDIFVRHCVGESLSALARANGISRSRAHAIVQRAVLHLLIGLPMTLPAGSGAWRVVKAMAHA
jgi:hypothetical protein